MGRSLSIGWFLLGAFFLVGCGASSHDETREWVASERNKTQPRITPLPEPKQFKPVPYSVDNSIVDPFSSQKMAQVLRKDAQNANVTGGLVAPELARRKEPLEAYPLDTMTMVGSIVKAGQPVGLLRVEGLLYQVRVGSYLGQNYGKITKITETEITMREIVQDAVGEWVERSTAMQLQEGTK